jgi:Na+/proline symporter
VTTAPQTAAITNVGGVSTAITMAAYFVVLAGIAAWAARRTRSSADFFVAGRSLGTVVLGISAMAATLSGFSFIGGPGLFYSAGATALFIVLPASLTNTLGAWALAGPLYELSRTRDVITIPGAIGARYRSRAAQGWAAVAILVALVGYVATNFLALGYVIDAVFGTGLSAGIWTGAIVVVAYSAAGGILAGVYADVFQGTVMAGASVAACWFALRSGGGLGGISRTIMGADAAFLSPWGAGGAMTALSYFFVFGVGSLAQPHISHKYLMARDARQFRWYPMVMTAAMTLTLLLYLTVGVAVKAMVVRGEMPALARNDDAMPAFLLHAVPVAVAGLVFAGVAAAIMSTVNSFLSVGAAAITHDLPRAFGRAGRAAGADASAAELGRGRVSTLLLALGAAAIAHAPGAQVAFLGVFGYGLFASTLVPALAIGLNWPGATGPAAVTSIVAGLVVTLAGESLNALGMYRLPAGVPWSGVALVVSTLLFVGVSAAGRAPTSRGAPRSAGSTPRP